MQKASSDELSVLYRVHESLAGCSELCQDISGAKTIRVRICNPIMQKEILSQLTRNIPARLSCGVLDLLLPWQEGQTLSEWLYAVKPNLGQRRDACLSLLADLITSPAVPSLITLSTITENLCFTARHCHLQLLPDLSNWHPDMQEKSMICSVASLIKEILITNQSKNRQHRFPIEMQLILRRCDLGSYTGLDSLQQDLAALPDELYRAGWFLDKNRAWLHRIATRYIPKAIHVIIVLLAIAALLSLFNAYRAWQSEQKNTWPGMTTVGDQVLDQEEEGMQ